MDAPSLLGLPPELLALVMVRLADRHDLEVAADPERGLPHLWRALRRYRETSRRMRDAVEPLLLALLQVPLDGCMLTRDEVRFLEARRQLAQPHRADAEACAAYAYLRLRGAETPEATLLGRLVPSHPGRLHHWQWGPDPRWQPARGTRSARALSNFWR